MTSVSSRNSSQALVPVVTAFSSRAPAVTRAILMSDTGLLPSVVGWSDHHDRASMLSTAPASGRGGFAMDVTGSPLSFDRRMQPDEGARWRGTSVGPGAG